MAHEIRNPLTAVQGFVQLLKNRQLGKKEQEYLLIIHEELQRVSSLVGEFLLLAKPAAPLCKNHAVAAVVKEVVNLMQSEALLKDVRLDLEIKHECIINADKEQIKQVIINLLKNALEATPGGKKITIIVTYNTESKFCLITIKDEGPGIPAADLKKIFDPFYTTKEDGTGLGLAVSFRIMENHGGKISVQSSFDRGSVFTLELPAIEKCRLHYTKKGPGFPESRGYGHPRTFRHPPPILCKALQQLKILLIYRSYMLPEKNLRG